eukprot:scaffold4937_cov30-Tisochrysis_lutea.AAC.2
MEWFREEPEEDASGSSKCYLVARRCQWRSAGLHANIYAFAVVVCVTKLVARRYDIRARIGRTWLSNWRCISSVDLARRITKGIARNCAHIN